MKTLYFDCFSGMSGDMTMAALVDLGADPEIIETELKKLPLDPFRLEWKRVNKKGVSALKMDVVLDPEYPPKKHRHYTDIVKMIHESDLDEPVKEHSLAIFEKIGLAEAKIHGISMERVHFHEVGAIDSIVDVIGTALAINLVEVDQIVSSPVPLGSGRVKCDHGMYPVPAPATLEIMQGLPLKESHYACELTTPTGAGIVAALVQSFSSSLPSFIVEGIGYGAGTRDLPDQPNIVRAVIGQRYS